MSIPRVTLNEVISLIDSPGDALVLLADGRGAALLRAALLDRPAVRRMRWISLQRDAGPVDFARRLAESLGVLEGECDGTVDRALDALFDSATDYTLILEGVEEVADRLVRSLVGYLLDFHPPELRIVLVGAASGVGIPRLLVRNRVRLFSLETPGGEEPPRRRGP